MSDSIEEIQSKKRRDAGLSAWAEMLERIQSRQMAPQGMSDDSGCGGGASLPRDTMQRQDPKVAEQRKLKLEALRANVQSMQSEARRMQDSLSLQPVAQPAPAATPQPVKTVAAPPEVHQQQVQAQEIRHEEQVQSLALQVEQLAEQALVLEAQAPLAVHTGEAAEKVVQWTSQAGLQAPASEEKVEELTSIEEAMQLMALKAGANPELAAKEYVLASELPGVRDSLSGGVYEDFRVAL
jgi:hypothetical protein